MNEKQKAIAEEFKTKITYLKNDTQNRNRRNLLPEKNVSDTTDSIKISSYIDAEN